MGQLDLWAEAQEPVLRLGVGRGGREKSCDAAQADRSERPLTKKNRGRERPAPDAAGWTLEPHVCRHCFARLVSKPARAGVRYACVNCGAEVLAQAPDALCSCGLKLRNHGPGEPLVDAGLRCQPNPEPRPEFPSLYVASALKL